MFVFACNYKYIDIAKFLLEISSDINRHKRTEYKRNTVKEKQYGH